MDYSDFKTSVWQTFWSSKSDPTLKENQIFEICDLENIVFTYAELKESIEDCLQKVKLHYSLEKEHTIQTNFYVNRFGELCYFEKTVRRRPTKISESNLNELKGYMVEFISDVERDTFLL